MAKKSNTTKAKENVSKNTKSTINKKNSDKIKINPIKSKIIEKDNELNINNTTLTTTDSDCTMDVNLNADHTLSFKYSEPFINVEYQDIDDFEFQSLDFEEEIEPINKIRTIDSLSDVELKRFKRTGIMPK